MLIFKFIGYQDNLSSDSLIVVSGATINGNSTYHIKIGNSISNGRVVENQKVITATSINKATGSPNQNIISRKMMENISCIIFKDSIFCTTTDKKEDGGIWFENLASQQKGTLADELIIINERLDPEILSFYQISLLNMKNSLAMSVKKIRYSVNELKKQELDLSHLTSILETINLYQLMDDQVLYNICKEEFDRLKENLVLLQNHLQNAIKENQGLSSLNNNLNTDVAILTEVNEGLSSLLETKEDCLKDTASTIIEDAVCRNNLAAAEERLREAQALNNSLEQANISLHGQKTQAEQDKNRCEIERVRLESRYRDLLQSKNKLGYIILTSMRFRKNKGEAPQDNTMFLTSEPNSLNEKANFIVFRDSTSKEIHILGSQNVIFNPVDKKNPYYSKGYYYLLKVQYNIEDDLSNLFENLLEAVTGDMNLYHLRFPIPSNNVTILSGSLYPGHIDRLLIGEITKKLQ
jgi:hypothetical protein